LGFLLLARFMSLNQSLHEIRHASRRAACALALTCALISLAGARQSSSSDPAPKASTSSPTTATHKTHTTSGKHSSRRKKSSRGQQKIDAERAQEIQAALIREHYLTGQPSGSWNVTSEEAMRRYQSDHGWQTKEVPDSRALISLGLGPSHAHLLNPESAMTTGPEGHAAPSTSTSPAADPGSTNKNVTPPADQRPPASSNQDAGHPQ
jgi:hypothetical protein